MKYADIKVGQRVVYRGKSPGVIQGLYGKTYLFLADEPDERLNSSSSTGRGNGSISLERANNCCWNIRDDYQAGVIELLNPVEINLEQEIW